MKYLIKHHHKFMKCMLSCVIYILISIPFSCHCVLCAERLLTPSLRLCNISLSSLHFVHSCHKGPVLPTVRVYSITHSDTVDRAIMLVVYYSCFIYMYMFTMHVNTIIFAFSMSMQSRVYMKCL